jgi:hypothetical protein
MNEPHEFLKKVSWVLTAVLWLVEFMKNTYLKLTNKLINILKFVQLELKIDSTE